MQILRKTGLKALKKAHELGEDKLIRLIEQKCLVGRGGAAFPTAKKWKLTLDVDTDERFLICNANEGEPGTFKDKFIIKNNPQTLVEGILIAAFALRVKRAFIYLKGEYQHLEHDLEAAITEVCQSAGCNCTIELILGQGAYVCGEETALINSIEGDRGQSEYRPPHPTVEGLWGKPTVINNVETLTHVALSVLFDDWDKDLRLFSLSGNVTRPGVYELPLGTKLFDLMRLGEPKKKIKAVYFGCFGGCLQYEDIELTPENICKEGCAHGAFTVVAADDDKSIVDLAEMMAEFFAHESCGKCTPCREGTIQLLYLIKKIKEGHAKTEDLVLLKNLAEHVKETSLCGLGQSATTHILTALDHFYGEFEEKIHG